MHKRGLCRHAVSVRPSVCLSVCLSRSWTLSKRVIVSSNFYRRVATPFEFFHANVTAIFWRDPPYRGVESRWGRQKSRFWANIWLHRVLSTMRPARCYQHGAAGPWQVVTLIASSKRRSLLMAGDDDEMFMTRSLNFTPKITEQHLVVRSDKSVAYGTNNKRLRSTFCTNYWQTRSIARPLCDSRAIYHVSCWQLKASVI